MNNVFRKAIIYVNDTEAGLLEEVDNGYAFTYNEKYIIDHKEPVSLTLPIRSEPYFSNVLFPFFDGLIPEGWILDITINNWKLNSKDRFGLLLVSGKDPIGNITINEVII